MPQQPVAQTPPFQPAFGTLLEHYLDCWQLWTLCRASPAGMDQNLSYLNAKIEGILFYSGVPTTTMKAANIPFPQDLIGKYERERQGDMKKALSIAKNQSDEEDILQKFRDDFLFKALSEILKALHDFLGEQGILHELLITTSERHGYSYFDVGPAEEQ